MKIGIIIAVGGGDIYNRFHETQQGTWISRKSDNVIIRTHTGGTAFTMAQRAIASFRAMPKCDVYMTTTSASYINTQMMADRLAYISPDVYHYGGVILGQGLPYINWQGKLIPQTSASGAGIIMSHMAFELLVNNLPDIEMEDDVLIGRTFHALGYSPNVITERVDVVDVIPAGKAWHYRFHTDNRSKDIKNMHKIHELHDNLPNYSHL